MAIGPNRRHPSRTRRPLGSRSNQRDSRRLSLGRSPWEARGHEAPEGAGRLELILRLRVMFGTAVTAELALRQQGAERDVEIADCLRAGVSEPLARAIQQLAVLGRREIRVTGDSEARDRSRGRTGARRPQRARRRRALR